MRPRFYILLSLSRPENMTAILTHFYTKLEEHPFEIRWILSQQGKEPDPKGALKANEAIGLVPNGFWFYMMADDTLCHPSFLRRLGEIIAENPDKQTIVFSGQRDKDGTILHALPENMKVCHVCGSQPVWNKSLIGDLRFDFDRYGAYCDGEFIDFMYHKYTDKFLLVDEPLTYFNSLQW